MSKEHEPSLDPPGDELSEAEWLAVWGPEIERRIREIDEGRAEMLDADSVFEEMEALVSDTEETSEDVPEPASTPHSAETRAPICKLRQ